MKEFCAFRPKAYVYLMDNGGEKKKGNGAKKGVIKRNIKFEDYTDCLFNNEAHENHNKDLKAAITMYILQKLIRLC